MWRSTKKHKTSCTMQEVFIVRYAVSDYGTYTKSLKRKLLYFSGFVVQYTKLCHAVSVAIIQEVFYGREQAVYHTIAG